MAASPAPVATRLPFAVGSCFPNDCPQDNQKYETFPATYPLRTHYLPTRECLKAAQARFGERAAGVLSAWHEVWRAAVGDVDAFAAGIGMDPLGPESPEDAPDEYPGWYGPNFIRPASFHVLEDAVALTEALRVGAPFAVMLHTKKVIKSFVPVRGLRRIAEYKGIPDDLDEALRPEGGFVSPSSVFAHVGKATPYWSQRAFRERAGRGMAVAGSPDELGDILLDMSAQGHAQAFLKDTGAKCGTWVVDIPAGGDRDAVSKAVEAALGPGKWEKFTGSNGERRVGRFVVQGMVPFVREHRFYVVAHRVAASTASDRMLSALDGRPDRILDERVARLDVPADAAGYYDRGFSTHEVDRRLVARMAWGARDLARALKDDDRDMDCYVVDMGETRDGRVLPIEVNGMPRAGHYGVPYVRVLQALRRRADRGRTGLVYRADPKRRPPDFSPHVAEATTIEVLRILREGDEDWRNEFLRRRLTRRKANPEVVRAASGLPQAMMGAARELGPAFRLPGVEEAFADPDSLERRRLLRFLARRVRELCLKKAKDMTHLAHGRLHLHKRVLCMGGTLAAEMAAPGCARGWVRADREAEMMPGSWLVHVEAQADDVDWPGSIAASISIDEANLALRPGARTVVVRVDATEGVPGNGDIEPGREFIVPAAAALAPARRPDVSVLDRKALLDAVPASVEVWSKCMRHDRNEIFDLIDLTGGDPERWAALGRILARVADLWEIDRRQDSVRATAATAANFRGDVTGRLCLTEINRPGRYMQWHPGHGTDRAWLVARVADLDVEAMASVFFKEGAKLAILRKGAVTWSPGQPSTESPGGLPEELLPRIHADLLEEA